MKVFVTGHRGYIGAHLVGLLKEAGHRVVGCDLGLFGGCGWEPVPEADREIVSDVRSLTARDLEGFDCVMHLAAISNDPMGASTLRSPAPSMPGARLGWRAWQRRQGCRASCSRPAARSMAKPKAALLPKRTR